MAIANCKRCGRIYNRIRRDICPACIAEEDEIFIKVRDFLREHKNAYMDEVIEGTDVETETLIQMIQDGRVILADNPNMGYACERCGGMTRSGRLCAKCSTELARSLAHASADLKKKSAEQKHKGGYYSK
jgi:flagellar operon protein (TIGR03826 family)